MNKVYYIGDGRNDRDIDTSDIPELDKDFFKNAVLTKPGENLIRNLNGQWPTNTWFQNRLKKVRKESNGE